MNELKVGLLTIATIVSIVVMSFKITSNQAGFGSFVTYKTIISDATGIFEKSAIKVAGINAGRIKKIELYEEKALITFDVLEEVKISKGSRIRIKSLGFLGDKYIDIVLNRSETQRIPEGSFINSTESGGLENLTKDASEILEDVKDIVSNIKQSISPEKEGDDPPLKKIVYNVKDSTERLQRIMEKNEEKINEMIENIRSMTQNLDYEVDDNNQDSFMRKLKKVGPILDDAKEISGDLKAVVARVRKGQGTLGKLINDEEVVDQVTQTLAGVNKLVNKVDSIRTELQVFSSHNTQYSNISEANLDIYPSPERFYRFGIVTSEFGASETIETRTTQYDGSGTVIDSSLQEKEEKEKDAFRFNAQIARKLGNWTIRAGIIESSGGLGVDYDLSLYNIKFYMDLFDNRDDIGPNLRVGMHVHFWNVIYGKIAGEDLLDKESLSLGAGLRFTDEDLKGLVAFLL